MPHTMPGAARGTGCHLLTWAVDAGHSVHAVARNPQADQPEIIAQVLKDAR